MPIKNITLACINRKLDSKPHVRRMASRRSLYKSLTKWEKRFPSRIEGRIEVRWTLSCSVLTTLLQGLNSLLGHKRVSWLLSSWSYRWFLAYMIRYPQQNLKVSLFGEHRWWRMLVKYVGDTLCWWQVWDAGDQHLKIVAIIKSPTWLSPKTFHIQSEESMGISSGIVISFTSKLGSLTSSGFKGAHR